MTSPSNLRRQTRIAKVECSKLFDRSGMRVWSFFILYSCRCWQIYVGDCLGWYYQFWTYSHILSKMFLPKSIQINIVLGTSVLSETSSEVSTKKRTRNDFHTSIDFPTFHALCGFSRDADHYVAPGIGWFHRHRALSIDGCQACAHCPRPNWWCPAFMMLFLEVNSSICKRMSGLQGYTGLYMDRSQMILGKMGIEWERDIDPRASWSSMFPIQILFFYLAIKLNKKC